MSEFINLLAIKEAMCVAEKFSPDRTSALGEAIFIIVEAYEQGLLKEADNWISVEERLPERDGYYIVNSAYGVHILGYENTEDIWSDENEIPYIVYHWQPLPEPPKEK